MLISVAISYWLLAVRYLGRAARSFVNEFGGLSIASIRPRFVVLMTRSVGQGQDENTRSQGRVDVSGCPVICTDLSAVAEI